jgi:hypothetical protein
MNSQFVTAKEIGSVIEMSDRHVRRPAIQRRFGISDFRDRSCRKPIRWNRIAVRARLSSQGYAAQCL